MLGRRRWYFRFLVPPLALPLLGLWPRRPGVLTRKELYISQVQIHIHSANSRVRIGGFYVLAEELSFRRRLHDVLMETFWNTVVPVHPAALELNLKGLCRPVIAY